MKPRPYQVKCFTLILAVGLSAFMAGCASTPLSQASSTYKLSDLEGTWSWTQDPWHGEFVLEMDGDSCHGVLNDVYEQTFEDKIAGVIVTEDHIGFCRIGRFGIQYWEGTLVEEDGQLKIVDGQWCKTLEMTGPFTAEKKD